MVRNNSQKNTSKIDTFTFYAMIQHRISERSKKCQLQTKKEIKMSNTTNQKPLSKKNQISEYLKWIDEQIEQWVYHILEEVEPSHQKPAKEKGDPGPTFYM